MNEKSEKLVLKLLNDNAAKQLKIYELEIENEELRKKLNEQQEKGDKENAEAK